MRLMGLRSVAGPLLAVVMITALPAANVRRPTHLRRHVHAIEFNTEWGINGFRGTRKILFYDEVEVIHEDYHTFRVSTDIHVIDVIWTPEFPRTPFVWDGVYVLWITHDDHLVRVTADYFQQTDTWGCCPEEADSQKFNRDKRPGLFPFKWRSEP